MFLASQQTWKIGLGEPKVRTLCSKVRLDSQKCEHFAQKTSWRTKSANPLLKSQAGELKVRTLCSKVELDSQKCEPFTQKSSWRAKSANPLFKSRAREPKV